MSSVVELCNVGGGGELDAVAFEVVNLI